MHNDPSEGIANLEQVCYNGKKCSGRDFQPPPRVLTFPYDGKRLDGNNSTYLW